MSGNWTSVAISHLTSLVMALAAENVVLRGHLVNQSARLTARLFEVEAAEAAAWRLEKSRDESMEILLRRVLDAVEAGWRSPAR
jgi:hypothetical protein